jgi:hypothetical protein
VFSQLAGLKADGTLGQYTTPFDVPAVYFDSEIIKPVAQEGVKNSLSMALDSIESISPTGRSGQFTSPLAA